jgi:hypothetical protein
MRQQQTGKLEYWNAGKMGRIESTTTRIAGGLAFTAIGGKRQGRKVPQSLRVKPGAKHPVWKTQSTLFYKLRQAIDNPIFHQSNNPTRSLHCQASG